jgi:AcrR family transcriptional regulator
MVASAAAEVLHEHGIEKLSMRQVAVCLGVTPMALYNHVRSKEDLLGLLADHLRAQVVVDEGLPPREQLLSLLTQLRDLGVKHPALLEGSAGLGVSTQAAQLAVLELRLLQALGLTPAQVRRAYQGLVLLVAGAALVWRARVLEPDTTSRLAGLIRSTASPEDLLLLDALFALPAQSPEETFAQAVDQVLAAAAAG